MTCGNYKMKAVFVYSNLLIKLIHNKIKEEDGNTFVKHLEFQRTNCAECY